MSTDPTPDPRRVFQLAYRRLFQLVYKRDGTPASGTFDSRADALAWLDSCPHGWPRVLFDVRESDPFPPVVPLGSARQRRGVPSARRERHVHR